MTTEAALADMKEQVERDKRAAYMRQYYDTHPEAREKKRKLDREYAAAHRQEALDRATAHYQADPEKHKARQARRNYDLKVKALVYVGGEEYGCLSCPESDPAVLQLHHRNPEDKLFSVSVKVLSATKRFPWEMIAAELDKCDILCGNCHAKHHSAWDHETWSTE